MFHSARRTLTAWYLLIIMSISLIFSAAFYHVATQEIERVVNRVTVRHMYPNNRNMDRMMVILDPNSPSLEDLEAAKNQIFVNLVYFNLLILLGAGSAGYFLAGRTLRPIQDMVDEQNQFVSNASHELRTPIATLRSEMEGSLLEKHITEKKARALIKSNLEELDTLQKLTDNLLQAIQVQSSTDNKEVKEIMISEVITNAVKKVSPLASKKAIKINTSLTQGTIKGNQTSLTELFVILLDNSIKYSPEKSIVTVSSKTRNSFYKIMVSDMGEGIRKEDLPHIFERFYRSDLSRSQTDGFGLGLSIAKKIVDMHNGSITVKSKENHGTTFTLTFPLS